MQGNEHPVSDGENTDVESGKAEKEGPTEREEDNATATHSREEATEKDSIHQV